MGKKRRYYTDEDMVRGVTPSELKRLGRERQKEYMRYWFHRNYQDPAHETPFESAEGGYLYIWGGPYNAKDELFGEFGDLIPEDRIDEVAEEVQGEDGIYDWAPGDDHPDRELGRQEWEADHRGDAPPEPEGLDSILARLEGGLKPTYGDRYELQLRQEVLERLDKLEQALAAIVPKHGGIGHNNPPPDDDTSHASATEGVRKDGEVIRTELGKPQPDALAIARSASRLQSTLRWIGKKLDVAAESFAKGFGGTMGTLAAGAVLAAAGVGATAAAIYIWRQLHGQIAEVVKHVIQWLSHVTLPF